MKNFDNVQIVTKIEVQILEIMKNFDNVQIVTKIEIQILKIVCVSTGIHS